MREDKRPEADVARIMNAHKAIPPDVFQDEQHDLPFTTFGPGELQKAADNMLMQGQRVAHVGLEEVFKLPALPTPAKAKPKTVWFVHIATDDWHGWTTVHSTEEAARLFLREAQYKDLSRCHERSALEALDDDDLHELWEDDCDGMGFYEETNLS
ncbi:hypothetical protein [Methylobacterium iners]|uniref:Uncharacterized protein n=1 Tax=Methylobacterium iners TaxID=418707 RepID=A0ABQ4RX65_9HYPH|nr:hypothetical protein [Methylobacterium iners]GJD94792.1 hypothetical protein OCOJLMKI_1996 [Methylobacterium iners]